MEEFRVLQESGLIRECDLEVVTTMILGSAVHVTTQFVLTGAGPGLDRLVDEMMDYHFRALVTDKNKDLLDEILSQPAGE